jgi:hypothetical protein
MKKPIEPLDENLAETITEQARRSSRDELAALEKAERVRTSANAYNYLFSSELKAPD